MWVRTENGTLVNLDRVTYICVKKFDPSVVWNEDKPWGIICHGDGLKGPIAWYDTQEEAEIGMAELYAIAKKV